jgi:hypothetical protein
MEKHWSNERQSPTWTINKNIASPEQMPDIQTYIKARQDEYKAMEDKAEKEKQERLLRQHPPIKVLFDRITLCNQPGIKIQIAKRMYIILEYLATPPGLNGNRLPTLEESLALLGRADYALELIEEIGKILRDASGYTMINVYPREAVQLRDLCRERLILAKKFIRALTFQRLKEEGIYEPKTLSENGTKIEP